MLAVGSDTTDRSDNSKEAAMGERIERDALGEVKVPEDALYGAETVRAAGNFQITGRLPRAALVRALAQIKEAAAGANAKVGALDGEIADAIARAAREVAEGKHADQFLVDPYQAGAGTSLHMNVNEVIANLAEELLGGRRGEHKRVHPNDHVNMGQSSNDVFPSATRVAVLAGSAGLLAALDQLAETFDGRAQAFAGIVKSGRTHLQDAVPITLGQEMAAYAAMIRRARQRLEETGRERVARLPLGGTATGTAFGAPDGYREEVVPRLAELTGLPLVSAEDLIEAVRNHGDLGEYGAALKATALAIGQITDDLRLLSMGPRTGLAEIKLPEVQPGSSIMPGKVNPSIPEMVNMVCMRVSGAEHTVALAVAGGQLDMNVMTPVIADELLEAIGLLAAAARTLAEKCVSGIEADEEQCRAYAEASLGLATALRPALGYAGAADVAVEAYRSGRTLKEVVREKGLLPEDQVDEVLEPARYT
jgi:fumarate hydratase class II